MFQLKVLMLSSCNIDKPKRSVVPRFLLHQYKLQELDLSRNSLGEVSSGLFTNLSYIRVLKLSKNRLHGQLCQLSNVSLIDLSSNSLFGSIPRCLQNIRTLVYPAFKLSGQDI
ncbi:hypothetical protein Ccrd_026398 [Cynara cardunculus var. scolymus]|uniref:Leucine-rich repeat-containing protein n=1 Tax=Cynara cardunculus var. scolymus TaxID=59895 RepID=A0A118HFU6_CYNCS|nr:hypothetical protein Ccrd_026398 [Cynara cardunculus var. scolymus]